MPRPHRSHIHNSINCFILELLHLVNPPHNIAAVHAELHLEVVPALVQLFIHFLLFIFQSALKFSQQLLPVLSYVFDLAEAGLVEGKLVFRGNFII